MSERDSQRRRFRWVAVATAFLLSLLALPGVAQEPSDPGDSEAVKDLEKTSDEQTQKIEGHEEKIDQQQGKIDAQANALEEQKKRIEELEKLIESQAGEIATNDSVATAYQKELDRLEGEMNSHLVRIDEQARNEAEDRQAMKEMQELIIELQNRLLELEDTAPIDSLSQIFEDRMKRIEASVEEIPEIPPDLVTTGDFPGSFRIPGTGAALRIGGWVRLSLVSTWDALGTEDRFITATIPVEGTTEAGKGARFSISAAASRFNIDLRTPTGVGSMRAFIEGDFAGVGETFRLRHAYGQYRRVIAGQTWSTMMDVNATPEDIDFEGLNARVQFRQPQVRWFDSFREDRSLAVAVALEDPRPDLTGATGIGQIPDLVARIVWTRPDFHIHISVVLRQLRGELESNTLVSTLGRGVSFSTKILGSRLNERDDAIVGINIGEGIGRYITDLRAEGGQDAVYDETNGSVEALPAFAFYVSLHHYWSENLHSTAVWGFVDVNNLDAQVDESYKRTNRASLNLILTPISRVDLGAEFIYGTRENKDGTKGSARQLQIAGTFKF